MLNYIKSEVYRNLRSKGNYIFLFGCMAFVLFINGVLAGFANSTPNFPYANTYFSFSSLYMSMGIPIALCLPMVAVVFGQEYKSHTLKNSISYGIARSEIYFGKFIVLLVIALINLILISLVYIGSAFLLLDNSGSIYLNELIRALVACMPLFLVSATVAHCFYFIFENETTVAMWWVSVMMIIPKILELLGARVEILRKIAQFMPWNIVKNITDGSEAYKFIFFWSSQQGLINCFIVGIVGALVFYLLGMKLFEKVEIK